jgi:hypothetical protein
MACQLCETRKPRRWCPGVRGEICPQCCGAERERTVDCPLDCEYLLEARRHEKPLDVDPETIPFKEIRIEEPFLEKNSALIMFLARHIVQAALANPAVVDNDVREALDALTRTYKTRESGLIYETRPSNPYAAGVMQTIKAALEQFEQRLRETAGMTTLRDADVFGVLLFLQRIEFSYNNQRPRGRSFLSFLLHSMPKQLEPDLIQ